MAATSDLVVEDVYRKHLRPQAGEGELRRAAIIAILVLTVLAWVLCMPRLTHLAGMIAFTGAFVGSTIWPIAAGLYWRRTNPFGSALGMVLGSAAGITCYFTIGWYVAALVGAAVSMVVVLASTWLAPRDFDWSRLREEPESAEVIP